MISSRSGSPAFDEIVWQYDNPTAGAQPKSATADWSFRMPDESTFLDSKWSFLRLSGRHLLDVLLTSPQDLRPIRPGGVSGFMVGFKFFARWMCLRSLRGFHEITQNHLNDYKLYIAEYLAERSESQMAAKTIMRYTIIPSYLFSQREQLRSRGVRSIDFLPFEGLSAYKVAKEIAPNIINLTQPIEDERFVAILTKALSWLDVPAADLIKLVEQYFEVTGGPGSSISRGKRQQLQREVVENFTFSTLPGASEPWHSPLQVKEVISPDGSPITLSPGQQLRQLILNLRDACTIVIEGLTGLRAGELAGLKDNSEPPGTLPSCITVRPNKAGIFNVFFIRGQTYKGHLQGDVEWVGGMVPIGAEDYPPPIRALIVLQRLFRPWRALSGVNNLVLSFSHPVGIPHVPSIVNPITSLEISRRQNEWVRTYVPEAQDTGKWTVSSRRWRRTFALHIFRCDSTLLPAISRHFKHLSIEFTDRGYIGNDPKLLGLMDSVWEQRTISFLSDILDESTQLKGPHAQQAADLRRAHVADSATDSGVTRLERLEQLVCQNKLRIFPSDWGGCVFRSDLALCHVDKGPLKPWMNHPNYAARCPGTCCKCKNLMVLAKHKEFWKDRKRRFRISLDEAERDGNESVRLWALANIDQCEAVLNRQ